jgi:hypothetical protein
MLAGCKEVANVLISDETVQVAEKAEFTGSQGKQIHRVYYFIDGVRVQLDHDAIYESVKVGDCLKMRVERGYTDKGELIQIVTYVSEKQ